MKTLRKIILFVLVSIGILTISGSLYQWSSARSDRAQHPPPGRLVELDELNIHLDCRGQGQPTIILEAGLTGGSTTWRLVHDTLAGVTRTCAYDRPGLDWSDPADQPVDSVEVADRLARLLAAAEITGNKVMVGMSAGGVFVREFYARHPDDVIGMVLIDSSHEQQGPRLPGPDAGGQQTALLACRYLQRIGIVRALSLLDPVIFYQEVPVALRPEMRANAYQSHTCKAIHLEIQGFENEIHDSAPPHHLGDLPLLVLSQGKPPKPDELLGLTPEAAVEMHEVWNGLQIELTELSSRGRRVIARDSGHMIQIERPDLVIDTITQLIGELRQPL
jgi:pimeloyl-ACP methyl ester carboxylesterase